MPRHSVRNSISRPFLPIKHALVRPKTERGISSDSPCIQLARALLESALKQEEEEGEIDLQGDVDDGGDVDGREEERDGEKHRTDEDELSRREGASTGEVQGAEGAEQQDIEKLNLKDGEVAPSTRTRGKEDHRKSNGDDTKRQSQVHQQQQQQQHRNQQTDAAAASRNLKRSRQGTGTSTTLCVSECTLCHEDGKEDMSNQNTVEGPSNTSSSCKAAESSSVVSSLTKKLNQDVKYSSRKSKSVDLSMISRPVRLHVVTSSQHLPPSSSSSASSHTTSIPALSRADKSQNAIGRRYPQGPRVLPSASTSAFSSASQGSKAEGSIPTFSVNRRRSQSVILTSTPPPTIHLSTISESESEEIPPSRIPSQVSATANSAIKSDRSILPRSLSGGRRSGFNQNETTHQEQKHNHIPCESITLTMAKRDVSPQCEEKREEDSEVKEERRKTEEDDEDWEILSMRKRRKSSKYTSVSSPFLNAIWGSSALAAVSSASTTSTTNDKLPRKRVASFRASSLFPGHSSSTRRISLRDRRASANDALPVRNTPLEASAIITENSTTGKQMRLAEIISKSPSTNLDIWTEHLQTLISNAQGSTDDHTQSHSDQSQNEADDSGFAPSLKDHSFIAQQQHCQERGFTPNKKALPRLPTLALVSPMGTLRRYISCPDGILQCSPLRSRRPTSSEIARTLIGERGEDVGGMDVPLSPCFSQTSDNPRAELILHEDDGPAAASVHLSEHRIKESEAASELETPSSSPSKKSLRRMSFISNLRETNETHSAVAPASTSLPNSEAPTPPSSSASSSPTLSGGYKKSSRANDMTNLSYRSFKSNTSKLWPPPEELFASLFAANTNARASSFESNSATTMTTTTTTGKKVAFSPSTRSVNHFPATSAALDFATTSTPATKHRVKASPSYTYDPNAPNARTALQLVPRDLNTDLEVKPWMVVMPRFVLNDLAVGMREWDKEKLEVHQQAQLKLRQKSV